MEENKLVDQMAAFLWDHNHEVYLWDHTIQNKNADDIRNIAFDNIIFISSKAHLSNLSKDNFLEENDFIFTQLKGFEKSNIPLITVICATGVYGNYFPNPHQIFCFEQLDQNALSDFLKWCVKINLFCSGNKNDGIQTPLLTGG